MVLPAVFRFQRFFAKLPDQNIGGEFAVRVAAGSKISHRYLPKTNILVTSFQRGNDQFELIDFMPRYNRDSGAYRCPPDIIRYIRHISGKPIIRLDYNPRPGNRLNEIKKEIRRRKKHFTFSKVLRWVAMDRAMKIAQHFSMQNYVRVWADMRPKIESDILRKGGIRRRRPLFRPMVKKIWTRPTC